jgi:hypothetical protein
MTTKNELQKLTHSVGRQLRLAGILGVAERLVLEPPSKAGQPWYLMVVRPNGVRALSDISDLEDGVGYSKPQVRTTLKAMVRLLVRLNR